MATIKPVSVTSNADGLFVLDSASRLWQLVKKTRTVIDPEAKTSDTESQTEEYHEWVQVELPEEIPA